MMQSLRKLAAALAVALGASTAAASPLIQCSKLANFSGFCCSGVPGSIISGGYHSFNVIGTRTTTSGAWGFSSFTMNDTNQVEADPLHTPGAPLRRVFTVYVNAQVTLEQIPQRSQATMGR